MRCFCFYQSAVHFVVLWRWDASDVVQPHTLPSPRSPAEWKHTASHTRHPALKWKHSLTRLYTLPQGSRAAPISVTQSGQRRTCFNQNQWHWEHMQVFRHLPPLVSTHWRNNVMHHVWNSLDTTLLFVFLIKCMRRSSAHLHRNLSAGSEMELCSLPSGGIVTHTFSLSPSEVNPSILCPQSGPLAPHVFTLIGLLSYRCCRTLQQHSLMESDGRALWEMFLFSSICRLFLQRQDISNNSVSGWRAKDLKRLHNT